MRFSGIHPDLSPEDKVVKRKLATCLPCAYSDLIGSNTPGSSGSTSSRLATLRPSPPSIMKFSHDGPPAVKPTKGELLARVETLSWRSQSVKRKALDSLEKGHSAWGKVPRLGMPITVWSPPAQSAEPPPSRVEKLGRKRSEADGVGDSLLFNAELAAGAVSSILRDSDLKRSGALPVEESLALSLQGVAFVSSRVLLFLILS